MHAAGDVNERHLTPSDQTEPLRLTRFGRISVITLDHPPVNALSQIMAETLHRSVRLAGSDPETDGIVIIGAGRTFIAGADLGELARTGRGPRLHSLLTDIEDCPKPVVAALHGTALGGGLEVAMACHYRLAAAGTQVGLPEVTLGIVPGGEGTQRLPRLAGMAKSVEMLVTGQPVKAEEALSIGLIDGIIEGDLLSEAIAFATRAAAAGGVWPKTRERCEKLGTPEVNQPILAAGREQAAKIRRNQAAPLMAIEALEAAAILPFSEGCRVESELSAASLRSDQAKALIHAFFAEREVARVPGIPKDTRTVQIAEVAIIGAGAMGAGIAMAMADSGRRVRITDASHENLDRGLASIRASYSSSVAKGRISREIADRRLALIQAQLSWEGFDRVDLVIEAVFEDLDLKTRIFRELDKATRPECILATNTSTLNIDEIAAATSRPHQVIGLHFFSPAQVMRLLEIVRGKATGPDVIAAAFALAKSLRKVGVLVGNCHGFVGNRMMFPYMREAQLVIEEGATPAQVDAALTEWGMAMGIFAVDDMGGLDLASRIFRDIRRMQPPGVRMPLVLDRLCQMGRLGQKTRAGWFGYGEGRTPIADPEIEELVRKTAIEAGIPQRAFTSTEIIERCIYAMINEGALILEEGYALRASDIDVIYMTGYGFPAWRGGPMWYADTVGLKNVYARVSGFYQDHGELWKPASLLRQLAEGNSTFAEFDSRKELRPVAA
jgi:3-hydroxyacyl-CoA dehydrogenase